jgi:hypothetical protein
MLILKLDLDLPAWFTANKKSTVLSWTLVRKRIFRSNHSAVIGFQTRYSIMEDGLSVGYNYSKVSMWPIIQTKKLSFNNSQTQFEFTSIFNNIYDYEKIYFVFLVLFSSFIYSQTSGMTYQAVILNPKDKSPVIIMRGTTRKQINLFTI